MLGSIQTRNGKMWRRNKTDLCIVEVTEHSYKEVLISFITQKVVRKELLQEIGEFDWLRKHVLQIDNARLKW